MPSTSLIVSVLVTIVAYWVISARRHPAVVPPHVPEGSPTKLLPPWFIFKPAVAINDFFHKMAQATTPPNVQVMNMATAYRRSEVLYALTSNGIIDQVGQKPTGCTQVATELELNEHAVCQYMSAGSHLGLLDKSSDNIYSLTAAGSLLQKDTVGSLRDYVLMINGNHVEAWRASGTKSIKSGVSGIKEAVGKEWWEHAKTHPEEGALFDRAMKSVGFKTSGAFLSSWKPAKNEIVFCDIGGGVGTTTALFVEHYPESSGIVFDQPVVSDGANSFLSDKGLSDRVKFIAGNFFNPLPSELASCDVFLLKYILHDWDDEACIDILKNIKAIAKPGAKVILIEQVLDTGLSRQMEQSKSLMSLNMLAMCKFGAKERTLEEFAALFTAADIEGEPNLVLMRDISTLVEVDI